MTIATGFFDADEHYYEAEDCFTRYASARMAKENFVRWLVESDGKRKRLLVGGRIAREIGNPTFNPIASPGIYHQTLKTLELGKATELSGAAFGKLEPIRPEYRDRDARLEVMDGHGVARTMMFPTLAVIMEGYMADDVELLYDAITAFNRWLEDDWGFAYKDRIYSAPYISLMDLPRALAEVDRLLAAGMRVITIRPGAAYGRSPADPYFDPFWARLEEAGVLVTYHAFEGPSLASEAFRAQWAARPHPWRKEDGLLQSVLASVDTAAMDTFAALIMHNLFGRFPRLRVASIEMGCGWVGYLMKRLDHAGGLLNRTINAFGGTLTARPSEIFRQHCWVAPFPEEDVQGLVGLIGADNVLMGSDWPHAEATPVPADYLKCLEGMPDAAVRAITHDNLSELLAA